jgi:hypothetical protein
MYPCPHIGSALYGGPLTFSHRCLYCRDINEFFGIFGGVGPRYEPVTYRVADRRTNQISIHTLLSHKMA